MIQKSYQSYKAHALTAKELCADIKDLIILFTRRLVNNQDHVEIIRSYIETTIPSVHLVLSPHLNVFMLHSILFTISRFLVSLRSPILNAQTAINMNPYFRRQAEFLKNLLHDIKTSCIVRTIYSPTPLCH